MSATRLIAAAVLVLVPLTGCAAGQHDVTSQEHATPWMADANVGPVGVRAVTIVPAASALSASPSAAATDTTSPSATPTASTGSQSAAQAYLTMTLVTTKTDTLIGASLSNGATVTPTDPTTDLTVRPQQTLVLGDPETGASGPALAITGLTGPLLFGTTVQVRLTFQSAGAVTLTVPVRDPATE